MDDQHSTPPPSFLPPQNVTQPPTVASTALPSQHVLRWSLVSAILMIVGAFGPWVTALGILTVHGTDGGRDGWILVGAGVAAAALLLSKRSAVLVGCAGLIGAAASIYDLVGISKVAPDGFLHDAVSPGWGIYVCVIASVSLIAASFVARSRP